MNVAVNALTSQGWLGSPLAGAQLSGVVPVTVASQQGYKIQSGILTLTSMANLNAPITLNSNTTTTTSTGQIGTIDTTVLPNGSYYLLLNATDDHGTTMAGRTWLTIVGDYKPGLVMTTITDAVVPAPGLAHSHRAQLRQPKSQHQQRFRLRLEAPHQCATGNLEHQ